MRSILLVLLALMVFSPAHAGEKTVLLEKVKATGAGAVHQNLTMGYHTLFCQSPFGVSATVEIQIKVDGKWQKATEVKVANTGGSSTGGTDFFVDKNYPEYRANVTDFSGEPLSCTLEKQ